MKQQPNDSKQNEVKVQAKTINVNYAFSASLSTLQKSKADPVTEHPLADLKPFINQTIEQYKVNYPNAKGFHILSNERINQLPKYEVAFFPESIRVFLVTSKDVEEYSYDFTSKTYKKGNRHCYAQEISKINDSYIRAMNDLKQEKATQNVLIPIQKEAVE